MPGEHTPTLKLFREATDGFRAPTTPPAMSWIAFRALQKYGKAPVGFYVFPDEGHGLIMLSHLKRRGGREGRSRAEETPANCRRREAPREIDGVKNASTCQINI